MKTDDINTVNVFSEAQFSELKQWCNDEVSTDIHFRGTPQQQYAQYLRLKSSYMDFKQVLETQSTVDRPLPEFNQMTPIQFAAMRGFDVYLNSIQPTSAQINQGTAEGGNTPLHLAASQGHVLTAQICIKHGAKLDALDSDQNTPAMKALMVSSWHDHKRHEKLFEQLQMPDLLKHRNTEGNTVFHLAAQFGFCELLKKLIDIDPAGLLEENFNYHCPIHLAIRQIGNSKETVELFFNHLETMRLVSKFSGEVPLHDACRYIRSEELANAFVEASLKAGVTLSMQNHNQESPILLAIKTMNKAMITVLTQHHGIKLTDKDFFYAYQHTQNIDFCRWIMAQESSLSPSLIEDLKTRGLLF
jgi:ankyrin repeat protein